MGTLWQNESTIVDCVRIRSRLGDSLAAQQRIGNLLRNATLRPSRLPPSAILCLRKLHDPAPGTWWFDHGRVYLPHEWEESATRELDRLVAQAVRPALGPVPPLAEAVLFLDRAEFLACLALDWLQGTLRANWWWFTLLKGGDADLVLFREWTRSPEFLPAALEALVARSRAVEFLQRLPDDVAASLLERVLHVFNVPEVSRPQANRNQAVHEESNPGLPRAPDLHLSEIPPVKPWLPSVPEASTPDLPLLKKALLAQALMLRRAPARARTIAFQREMAEWQFWAAEHAGLRPVAEGKAQPDSRTESGSALAPANRQALEPAASGEVAEPTGADFGTPRLVPNAEGKLFAPAGAFPAVEPASRISASSATALETVESAFGGVFFLINVALYLKLYADFASPLEESLELDIWDFVCLLSLEFVGEETRDDPLFEVLATLAGRTKWERPGAYFHPPAEWHMPLEWLEPFPEPFERKEVIRGGRLQVIHPAGFVVEDESRDASAERGDGLSRWLDWIAGYIRARLSRALGRDDAAEFLCRVPARVAFTATRVDVFYSLDQHPIEIRLAGLDRDPGWVPAAGRFVAFHFE